MVQIHPVQAGYAAVFGLAALGCFVAAYRARRIHHDDTRWGLVSFLALVGSWGVFETGRIIVPSTDAKVAFYLLGLTVGLASGGAWLYFASAYAGNQHHRNPTYRRLAFVAFVVLVAVKFTNPIHHQYFATRVVSSPFPHLVVEQGLPHWIITGLLYVVAGVGFYMLFQVFVDSHVSTTSLGVVVMLAGVPIVLDVLGYTGIAGLLELNYEPIGVAAFGIGALFFVEESFVAVQGLGRQQIVDELTEAVVLTDTAGRVHDYNDRARDLFPTLEGSKGKRLTAVLPRSARGSTGEDRGRPAIDGVDEVDTVEMIEFDRDGDRRYYLRTETPLSVGAHTIGRALVFLDVTRSERQRRELDRQNEQLDGLAVAIAHELRNAISVVAGQLEIAATAIEAGDSESARESLRGAQESTDRIAQVVHDLTTLARYSQSVDDVRDHEFRPLVASAWSQVGTDEFTYEVEGDGTIGTTEDRFVEILRNAVLFARHHDATGLVVSLTDGGFQITVAGVALATADPAAIFEHGTAVPDAESGRLTANVQALARAHGWRVEGQIGDDTVAFTFSDVDVEVSSRPGE